MDKAELNSLINDAMKINEKEDEKDTYTQESWDDFQKGLSIAEAVNKKENPSQSDVTKAVNLLVKYTKGLEKKFNPDDYTLIGYSGITQNYRNAPSEKITIKGKVHR